MGQEKSLPFIVQEQDSIDGQQAADLPASIPAISISTQPTMSMAEVLSLVRACSAEICGEELAEEAHFAEHHFDSLAAVELASSIGKAVGINLPSQLFKPCRAFAGQCRSCI